MRPRRQFRPAGACRRKRRPSDIELFPRHQRGFGPLESPVPRPTATTCSSNGRRGARPDRPIGPYETGRFCESRRKQSMAAGAGRRVKNMTPQVVATLPDSPSRINSSNPITKRGIAGSRNTRGRGQQLLRQRDQRRGRALPGGPVQEPPQEHRQVDQIEQAAERCVFSALGHRSRRLPPPRTRAAPGGRERRAFRKHPVFLVTDEHGNQRAERYAVRLEHFKACLRGRR